MRSPYSRIVTNPNYSETSKRVYPDLTQCLCHLCSSLAEQFDGYFRRVKGLPLEAIRGVEKNNISSGQVKIQLWEKYFRKLWEKYFCKLWEKYFCKWSTGQKFVPMKEFVCGGLEVISVEGSGWLLAPTPPEFNWPPPSKQNKNDAGWWWCNTMLETMMICNQLHYIYMSDYVDDNLKWAKVKEVPRALTAVESRSVLIKLPQYWIH